MISEKRVMYDHNVDQKGYKWWKIKTKKISNELLPEHVNFNLKKYESWLD